MFYAKPLVWTPPGGPNKQVIVVSNQNNIRILDGLTGTVINQRTLDPPFQSVDTGNCGDIPNTVGITGTPIIDPATDIMYLFSKGYKGAATGPAGTLQGQYKFYAIQLPGLTDVFPAIIIDGHYADNDHTRYFVGGTVLNRQGLAMLGNTIIGGFGGHCDNFNYTGINGAGGAGDNGKGISANGKIPISTLQQATVDMGLSSSGVFAQNDYFEPYEYASLDGGDTDFGSSGAALLSPYFSGGGVSQVVVAGGKSGKIYFMDANNLGGFATGDWRFRWSYCPTSQAGAGAYLYADKFTTGANGVPQFVLAGQSAIQFAGVGAPTVTSLNGQTGSAIVWLADVNNGLVAYNAIPVDGVLQPISTVSTGRLQKYQRPAFGNARVYTTETNQIYGIDASTTPAITCASTSVGFGSVVAGLTKVINVKCTAGQTALTMNGCSTNLDIFQCSGVPATLAAGASFTMAVTLNLTSAAIELTRTANCIDVAPGAVAGSLSLMKPSGVIPYASLPMTATVTATGGYIDLSAVQIDFSRLSIGTSSTASLLVKNDGAGAMSFTGFAYQNAYGAPYQNVSTSGSPVVVGSGFTAIGLPVNGATIASKSNITISLTFTPTVTGSSASILTFWSNGGWKEVMLVGTASACTVSCSTLSQSSSTTTILSSSSSAISSSMLSSSSSVITSSLTSSSLSTIASSTIPTTLLSNTLSTSALSSTSSLVVSSTSSTLSSTSGPSSNIATTTSLTTLATSVSSSSVSSATGYAYMGCFVDTASAHALPLLLANNSITPQVCESLVSSLAMKPTPTIYPFYYVEYHRECYAGSSFSFGTQQVTSLYGAHACTDVCSGSIGATSTGTAFCGGSRQFNLYATKSSVPFVVATTQSK
ncbi:uncharacterized protein LY89DRAFT_676796 [Mollisia scopiformis]|uniref:WSC domain-containing protein n=1 Tax=Mollisia scopiformis TaxID=149040 RepID=A0A132B9I1_MOLSC|nr:uncharacterized protein LY89DRAFT_676796 [Mollisia scopiformis]KUJ08913.1 hypothetical protein LY89DRAFT_676796 [Mollisia scopiformis]